jgi:hypothetical protein
MRSRRQEPAHHDFLAAGRQSIERPAASRHASDMIEQHGVSRSSRLTGMDLLPKSSDPSEAGRKKFADMLLNFFKTYTGAKTWFVKSENGK